MKDDAQGLAAQLAFYFFLSLFPALLSLIALASLFPIEHLTDEVVRLLSPFAPADVVTMVRDEILRISTREDAGLFSVAALGAVWTSSSAMGAVVNAMNRAYDIEDRRPWWRVRVLSVLLTLGLAVFILLALCLVVLGPQTADYLQRWSLMSTAAAWVWKVLQWPVVFLLVSTAIGLIYYMAPDADQDWYWITPGSLFAALLWLAGSLGFRAYVVNFASYESTYGAIGGVIVVMMWFYLTGFIIVVGAELNAEIEHASPWGQQPYAYSAPGRRCIGPAAQRHFTGASPMA